MLRTDKEENEQDGKDAAVQLACCSQNLGVSETGCFSKVGLQKSMLMTPPIEDATAQQ